MSVTRPRRTIIRAAEARGRTVAEITWTPIRKGPEMAGASGGWEVLTTSGEWAIGVNVADVVGYIGRWPDV